MGLTEETGVVDKNCRVFGVNNLFVAGTSVFPFSGHANPTLTAVALGIRLAHKLSASSAANLIAFFKLRHPVTNEIPVGISGPRASTAPARGVSIVCSSVGQN